MNKYTCKLTALSILSFSSLFGGPREWPSQTWNWVKSWIPTGSNTSGTNNITTAAIEIPPPPTSPASSCKDDSSKHNFAVVDWLNSINIGRFFDYKNRYYPRSDSKETACFVFNSFDNVSTWAEPYSFYSSYKSSKKDQKIEFKLLTFGIGGGARVELYEDLDIGGSFGYFHSNLKPEHGKHDTSVNGVYFGPSVGYRYLDGFAGFSLIGVKNFYGKEDSWDLDARVEAEYAFDLPSQFSLHPFARIDYLNVFESYNKNHSSFLYSKVGTQADRLILCHTEGFLSAGLSASYINMLPLTAGQTKCDHKSLKTDCKNQFGIGAKVVGMHMCGLLASLEYEASIGAEAPIQSGRARVEWNW